MTDYNRAGAGDIDAIKQSDGSVAANAQGVGCTLVGSNTYLFPFGNEDAPTPSRAGLAAVHLAWNAAFAGTITIESCNFPLHLNAQKIGGTDVADTDINAAAANWIQENPTVTLIVVGTGNSAANLVITAGGTNFGGTIIHLGNLGSRRVRVKAVCTTGGVLRVNVRGKQAA